MSELADPARPLSLLHYRPWQAPAGAGLSAHRGRPVALFVAAQALLMAAMFTEALWPSVRLVAVVAFVAMWGLVTRTRAWPIARASLGMLFRRKLFWVIYALALLVFLLFFFGQYLMFWALDQLGEQEVRVGGLGRANPKFLVEVFSKALYLNGSAETFRNFFWFEGYCVMVVLALAGAVLVGNDLRFGSLPFYLSKPISRWDYLLGKGLAVAVFANLLTTLPAVVLFAEYCALDSWEHCLTSVHLLAGILAYGLILSVCMTCVLLATATWLQRTVPVIMAWTTLFFFCRMISRALVDGMQFDARWRLLDLWNGTYLLGNLVLGIAPGEVRPSPQPAWYEAALVVGGVSLLCLSYLILRIRGVEIVK
jgi:ABC-type transport system involved in multi-copper enzyme maturation permease subunit